MQLHEPTMSAETQRVPVRVAAIQAEPEWNDLQAGVDKAIKLIKEAGANGAHIVGFPEVFIPGYPWSVFFKSPLENAKFMDEYFRNSLVRESEEMNRIRAAVKETGIFVVLGYSERYKGSLYIAQSFIDENGDIVHHRRKVKPTHVERAYWADGQGESLQTVVKTARTGNVGGLNCWEHTQTLLRYYEYAQDVDIHVSSWPLLWNEDYGNLQYHITANMCSRLSQVIAMEGACFVLLCSQIMTPGNEKKNNVEGFEYVKTPGGGFSMIFGPTGEPLVEAPNSGEEVILYANIDLHDKWMAKQNLDVVGHYARPDQLSLRVNSHASKPVHYANEL
ncbi:hypothetical protein E4T43_04760 [Aureobasidium subglaciale]|nr:hypothetical protein E4T43_04760 [Aureobasidium subglaciale]